MAAPPASKSITLEQVPDEHRRALQPVLQQLNPFMSAVGSGLNKSLTFTDNFVSQIQDLTFTAADEWIYPGLPGGPVYATTNFSPWGNLELGFRKRPDGDVELNEGLIAVGGSTPTDDELLFQLPILPSPAAWAPTKDALLQGFTRDGSSKDTFASFSVTAGGLVKTRFITTWYASSFLALRGKWTPADRSPIWSAPFPLSFTSKLPVPAKGLLVLAATVTDSNNKGIDDPKTNVGPVWVDWVETSQGAQRTIKVRGVAGTVPGKSYRLTLLIVGG